MGVSEALRGSVWCTSESLLLSDLGEVVFISLMALGPSL